MDYSAVSICNMALGELGQPGNIISLTQSNKAAALCNQWYDVARKELLASAPWSCCKRWKAGVLLGTDAMPPWTYAYSYPSDALRIHHIKREYLYEPKVPFEVSMQASGDARQINSDAVEPVFIYSVDVENPARFDPDFVTALSKLLASKMCMALTKNMKMKVELEKAAMGAASVALAAAFNEGVEDVDKEPFYQAVR